METIVKAKKKYNKIDILCKIRYTRIYFIKKENNKKQKGEI